MVSRQKGVALISVLLIVAILLAVVGRLMSNHGLSISQSRNVFEQNQALQFALGAETMARQALFEDFSGGGGEVDHMSEPWAQQVLPFELDEGGFIEAQLTDLHGCFNLNNVVGAEGEDNLNRFKRLLVNLNIPQEIADTWKDWIDDDLVVSGFGAEDSEYLIGSIPYRTPNQKVVHISELALLRNLDGTALAQILPFVCLLPEEDTKVNVNTANLHTLSSLHGSLSPDQVESVVSSPREFVSVADFVETYPSFIPVSSALSVASKYFRLHAYVQVGTSSLTLQSILHRDPASGEVTVLSRDFGKLFRSAVEVATEEAS